MANLCNLCTSLLCYAQCKLVLIQHEEQFEQQIQRYNALDAFNKRMRKQHQRSVSDLSISSNSCLCCVLISAMIYILEGDSPIIYLEPYITTFIRGQYDLQLVFCDAKSNELASDHILVSKASGKLQTSN